MQIAARDKKRIFDRLVFQLPLVAIKIPCPLKSKVAVCSPGNEPPGNLKDSSDPVALSECRNGSPHLLRTSALVEFPTVKPVQVFSTTTG
jgi:hypothetical protein